MTSVTYPLANALIGIVLSQVEQLAPAEHPNSDTHFEVLSPLMQALIEYEIAIAPEERRLVCERLDEILERRAARPKCEHAPPEDVPFVRSPLLRKPLMQLRNKFRTPA